MLSSAYRSARATLLILAGLLGSREALAQDSGAAAALFEDGLADMTAGRLAAGCPKLAESYRLGSRPGAVFTLAECESRWGKLASALAHYDDYLRAFEAMPESQKSAQRERAAVAAEQRTRLKERVPRIKLIVPATAPKGTVVRKDGVLLGPPSLGVAFPVDPGTHRITTQAPGGAAKEHVIEVAEGQSPTIDLQVLPAAVPQSSPKAVPTAPAVVTSGSRVPWAIAAFGISAVGVGTGIATGLMALGTKDEIKANCVGTVCSQEGKDAADEGQALGWASTVAFGVSFASAGAGTVLLVTEPKESEAEAVRAAQVRPKVSFKKGGAQISVAGNF